jgi:hypothetical protein
LSIFKKVPNPVAQNKRNGRNINDFPFEQSFYTLIYTKKNVTPANPVCQNPDRNDKHQRRNRKSERIVMPSLKHIAMQNGCDGT